MNKLISRNPVQRFKQGRKITKFYGGGIPNDEYVGGGTKIVNWLGNLFKGWSPYTGVLGNTKSTSSTSKTTTKSQTTTTPKTQQNKTTTSTGTTPPYELSSDAQKVVNERNKRIAEVENQKRNSQPVVKKQPASKTEYDNFLYAGKMGGWNKSIGLGNIKDQESLDIIKQLGWEGKSAEEVQKLLNSNDIGGNRVVVDNKWGNQSKAALQNYYNRWLEEQKPVEQKPTIQLPKAPVAPTLQRQAISDYSNYAQNLKQALGGNSNFSGLSNLVWKEYADDDNSFAANFSRDMRTRFKDYGTQQSWLDNQAAIEKALNIFGRYRGTNNGDYGDIANSMANWAGGYNYNIDKQNQTLTNDYNKKLDYYNAIIDKYKRAVGGYKMGGLLPSRNIIERFKQGRKIIFAQGGTYFPVTVGGRTYQYNPYNGSYKGTQGSGQNISYKDIEGAFNKQYEGVSHSGIKVYSKRGSHTTWTNSTGKQVNLAPAKKAQPNTSFKTSANGRFRVVDQTSGKELRFDSRDEAKRYQMSATKQGTRVLYDDKKEGYGVLKVDRTKEKSTEWARNQRETNNNKSRAEAYKAARERGDRWFAYDGKVYSSDLKNYKNDNLTEMKAIYGNDLGWGKDPKYNTKSSAQARNAQNKEIKAQNSNRNANYQGKTNKQASAEADKKVAQTWNEEDFVDSLSPFMALNGVNYLASKAMGEDFHPTIYHSGFNPALGMANLMRGEWNKVGERALNAASIFGGPWIGRGVKWLGTRMAPEIANLGSKSAYLSQRATVPVANGTGRTLNKMAERAISGNFTSPTTTYGRYSLQKAADKGLLDQFATNGGFNNAVRWGNTAVRNNNTGTTYIFRNTVAHPYDAAVEAGSKVIPWVTSFGLPAASTTLHNLTEE